MKVVLIKNFQGLGKIGDVKEVSEGYARNFLVPKGIVAIATSANLKTLRDEKKILEKKQEKYHQEYEHEYKKLKEVLQGKIFTVRARANKEHRLFAQIHEKDICEALWKNGIRIKEEYIILTNPIKELGKAKAKICFPKEEPVEIKLTIAPV